MYSEQCTVQTMSIRIYLYTPTESDRTLRSILRICTFYRVLLQYAEFINITIESENKHRISILTSSLLDRRKQKIKKNGYFIEYILVSSRYGHNGYVLSIDSFKTLSV